MKSPFNAIPKVYCSHCGHLAEKNDPPNYIREVIIVACHNKSCKNFGKIWEVKLQELQGNFIGELK